MKRVYLPASETFVYQHETDVLGFISMVDNHIAVIFVKPEEQGRGIGKQLIEFVKNKYPLLTLGGILKKCEVDKFFKKQGFVITGEKVEENAGEMETLMQLS